MTVAYYATARLGLRFSFIGESISPIWPATGLALAALVLLGPSRWPAVLLGAFLANAMTSVPLPAVAGIAIGNTLEALAGAWLLRRFGGSRPSMDDSKGVLALVLFAAPLGALLSATIGVSSLYFAGMVAGPLLPPAVGVWFLGDALGALIVVPPILAWSRAISRPWRSSLGDSALLVAVTALVAHVALGSQHEFSSAGAFDLPYLLFPCVIWAALRFGPRGASLATLVASGFAVWHIAHGEGPFIRATTWETTVALLACLGVLALTGLVMGAIIVERREGANTLRETSESLRALIEASPLAIYTLDPAGLVRTWNTAAERIFGWRGDEVIGRPSPLVPADDRWENRSLRERVLQGETLDGVELTRLRRDGQPFAIRASAAPVYDASGRVAGILGIAMDVSQVKQLEAQVNTAKRIEAVGRLAGGVAHDFNNLLTAILGNSDLLLGTLSVDHPGREDAEEIRKAAVRASGLTHQLLAFSRRQVMQPKVLELNAVVMEMDKMLRRLIGEDIELHTVLPADLGAIRADPSQLEQIIANLVVNARDAMPQGGRLTIETADMDLDSAYASQHPMVKPGPYVMLSVSDNGVGMTREVKAHIFEPFFTTKEQGKGTGLGLATVYGIVKQSDGYVWVYSEPGLGTTFKIYLPRVGGRAVPGRSTPAQGVPRLGTETILIAEDEDLVRNLTQKVLESRGYQVLAAANGTEALALAAQHPGIIHLLATDVVMPGMNGRELSERLAEVRPDIRILFLSGYTDDAIVHHGVLEEGVNFLQKPFTPSRLAETVREVLDGEEEREESVSLSSS